MPPPIRLRRSNRLFRWAGAGLALALCGCSPARDAPSGPIGLFTTLPILWQEAGELSDLLRTDAPPHWALAELQAGGSLQPLDRLTAAGGARPLAGLALLVMAQPRPLSPDENVALDEWVRGGGRVLLFADPMLTAESSYALGDRRRPQDVVLLSPILARWGLELHFDENQVLGERAIDAFGAAIPANLPGHLSATGNSGDCRIDGDGLAARCRVGAGEALVIADAALFETPAEAGEIAGRRSALGALLNEIR